MDAVPKPGSLTRVAEYRRTVAVSVERIRENVLDWEHLPYLHAASFSAIRCLRASDTGWRAVVTFPDAREATIEVEIDRSGLGYRTCTLEGSGRGNEIATALEPRGDHECGIAVEFFVPGAPDDVDRLGRAFRRLYAHLWDEDEAMMIRRQAVLDAARAAAAGGIRAASAPLGPVDRLPERASWLVDVEGRSFRLLSIDGRWVAHAVVCPHRGGPLENAPTDEGCLTCPWHGYRFDLRTGQCIDTPALRIEPAASVSIDPATGLATLVVSAS